MSRASRLDPRHRRSLRHSQQDAAASAVMTGLTDHYLAAYALLLRASPQQIAWLAAFPALMGALFQLVAVWILGRRWRRMSLIVAAARVQALAFVPMALLMLVPDPWAVPLLIANVVVYQLAGNALLPAWRALMADLVPEHRRGRFFARRTRAGTVRELIFRVARFNTISGVVFDVMGAIRRSRRGPDR